MGKHMNDDEGLLPASPSGPSGDGVVTPNPWGSLRRFTAARIALGRSGVSQPTAPQLEFQLAHARARDAVHLALDHAALGDALRAATGLPCLPLHSAAVSRDIYLQRPDLGRRLDDASRRALLERPRDGAGYDLAFVIADGLSALAIEQNVRPFLTALMARLAAESWSLAPLSIVRQGRVAVGDEVGELLGGAGADRRTPWPELAGQHGPVSDLGAARRPERRRPQLHLECASGGLDLRRRSLQASLPAVRIAPAPIVRRRAEG
jgi:ethanolamine ammonia-lyase small subunit